MKKKIFYVFFLLLSVFILSEVLLRITGSFRTYSEVNFNEYFALNAVSPGWYKLYAPNTNIDLKRPEFTYIKRSNSLGFIDKEWDQKISDTNSYTILGLGDSFMEGVGAPQDSSWLSLLEHQLKHKGVPVAVYNAGISGSDIWYEYMLLQNRLQSMRFDMVVVGLNSSDINDFTIRGGFERFRLGAEKDSIVVPPPLPWWEPLYHYSHLVRAISAAAGYNFLLQSRGQFSETKEKALVSIYKCLLSFKELAEHRKFRLVVIINPQEEEIDNADVPVFSGDLPSKLTDKKIYYIDMEKEFSKAGIGASNKADLFWQMDAHHNSKGYTLFARIVADKLLSSDSMFVKLPAK